MGIFYNFKINSLVKSIKGKYEPRMEKLARALLLVPDERNRLELATQIIFSENAHRYALRVAGHLFHPKTGLFRNDIHNILIEHRFEELYQYMAAWFAWSQIPVEQNGLKNTNGLAFCIKSLRDALQISEPRFIVFYKLLSNTTVPEYACYYRMCILAMGHTDSDWERLHENSIECKLFIQASEIAKRETEADM